MIRSKEMVPSHIRRDDDSLRAPRLVFAHMLGVLTLTKNIWEIHCSFTSCSFLSSSSSHLFQYTELSSDSVISLTTSYLILVDVMYEDGFKRENIGNVC